jgi:hypothetical protein
MDLYDVAFRSGNFKEASRIGEIELGSEAYATLILDFNHVENFGSSRIPIGNTGGLFPRH